MKVIVTSVPTLAKLFDLCYLPASSSGYSCQGPLHISGLVVHLGKDQIPLPAPTGDHVRDLAIFHGGHSNCAFKYLPITFANLISLWLSFEEGSDHGGHDFSGRLKLKKSFKILSLTTVPGSSWTRRIGFG